MVLSYSEHRNLFIKWIVSASATWVTVLSVSTTMQNYLGYSVDLFVQQCPLASQWNNYISQRRQKFQKFVFERSLWPGICLYLHQIQKNACTDRTGTAFMIHFFTALFQTTQVDLSRLVLAMSFITAVRKAISWHSCQKNACADRTGTAFMIHFFTALFQTTQVDLSRLVLAVSFITAVRKAISWHSCQSYSIYVESILSKQHVWLGDTLFYCFTLREALAKIPGVMNLVGRNLVVNSGL